MAGNEPTGSTRKAPARPKTTSSGPSNGDVRLAEIATELRGKPGTLTILGVVLAAVALPTGILGTWFGREVDAVNRRLDLVASNAEAAAKSSADAAASSQHLVGELQSLIVAIARDSAQVVKRPEQVFALKRILPSDVFLSLEGSGHLNQIRYSEFNDQQWIFINASNFNTLTSDLQADLRSSLDNMQVRFVVDQN